MIKNTLITLSCVLFIIYPLFAQTDKQTHLNIFLQTPGLRYASVGLCVKDMSGNVIISHNMNKSYTPASILKIATTATAFETLGSNFKYETILAKDSKTPNRLLIHGSGDPSLGSEHLDKGAKNFPLIWAKEIEKAFPQKQAIDIMIVDNLFGYEGVSRKWIYEDIGNYYAAGTYGISIFDNTYKLSFNTKALGTKPELIGTDPKMKDLKFVNTLSINNKNEDNGYIVGAPLSNERTIIGDLPANRTKFVIKGAIPNPGLFLGQTIAETLQQRGIKTNKIETSHGTYIKDIEKRKPTIFSGTTFYRHISPPLADIAKEVNINSNNHYAEHLIRTIGRKTNADIYSLALEEGIEQIESFWKNKGLNTNTLFMYDGCGLAPSNAVSSELLTDILVYMQVKSRNSIPFINSLPRAGKDGTVRNFLKGTRLDSKVYVKSGSIANVQCFAGYYIDGNKKYAFTIMVNQHDAPRVQVVKAIEKLLQGILQ